MNVQSIVHMMENWGYYLLPRSHPSSPGYTGLLVAIRETPTEAHFDPKTIRLQVRDEGGAATRITLGLRSPFQRSRHVCLGRVVLRDRVDKRVDFFVLGGSLDIAMEPGETVYALRSPAPILEVTDHLESISDQLAFETEAMIGEMQARWGTNDQGFARRLSQVDPLQFYLASLHSVLARYGRAPTLQESFPHFYRMLLEEKEWLTAEGQWSATLPALEELLAPDWTG